MPVFAIFATRRGITARCSTVNPGHLGGQLFQVGYIDSVRTIAFVAPLALGGFLERAEASAPGSVASAESDTRLQGAHSEDTQTGTSKRQDWDCRLRWQQR